VMEPDITDWNILSDRSTGRARSSASNSRRSSSDSLGKTAERGE